jgi:hypothetical protein
MQEPCWSEHVFSCDALGGELRNGNLDRVALTSLRPACSLQLGDPVHGVGVMATGNLYSIAVKMGS